MNIFDRLINLGQSPEVENVEAGCNHDGDWAVYGFIDMKETVCLLCSKRVRDVPKRVMDMKRRVERLENLVSSLIPTEPEGK